MMMFSGAATVGVVGVWTPQKIKIGGPTLQKGELVRSVILASVLGRYEIFRGGIKV